MSAQLHFEADWGDPFTMPLEHQTLMGAEVRIPKSFTKSF